LYRVPSARIATETARAPGGAGAPPPPEAPLDPKQRLSRLGLNPPPAPSPIKLKNGFYAFAPGLIALPVRGYRPPDGAVELERNGGFVFLRADPGQPLPEGALPVAMNLRTQALGAVTGVVAVKLAQPDSASSVASDYQLKTVQTFEGIHLAYLQSSSTDPAELLHLVQTLRTDPRIARADLEILDKWRIAQ
jgi:hypothetical protein